ncbi:MAG: radical SAM protein [Candidatus Omnitrophica bacterium]|nr:radical SAM protein [Candidatus Omnitrophota bacterium]
MKVKLVLTPYYFYNAFMPPLGLAIVSEALKRNNIEHDTDDLYIKLYHAVKLGRIKTDVFLDPYRVKNFVHGIFCDEIDKETGKIMALTDFSGYDYVCFSSHFPPLDKVNSQAIAACLMRKIKEKYGPTIVANFKLSSYEDAGLIDFHTLRIDNFINFLRARNKINPELPRVFLRPNFKGLPLGLYRYSRDTVISEFLPQAARVSNLSRYRAIAKSLPLLLPYIFIDGCQYNCIFCEFSENPGFKIKDYDEIVNDLKFLSRAYKTRDFFFLNSNINPTREVVRNFTDRILKGAVKINFTDCATFNNLDEEILVRLKDAGAVRLVIGLESASLRLQRYVGKVINLDHASRMLKMCYNLGIWAEIDLLIGLPFESPSDVILTLEFIKDNYRYIRGVNLNRFLLKWQSLMYKFSAKYGIINIRPDRNLNFAYDEDNGMKWDTKKKLMEYRYSRFLACLDRNKVDYFRPVQFVFALNRQFKDPRLMNKYLDKTFFADRSWKGKIDGFINELNSGEDMVKAGVNDSTIRRRQRA